MTETTQSTATTVAGFFPSRAQADSACARLRAVGEPRLGVAEGDDPYVVTLADLAPEQARAARAALRDAGAARIDEGEPASATAPRPVQPGFTDAAPGVVPEAADFPAEKYEDAGGRFAEQIDKAPETPRRDDTR